MTWAKDRSTDGGGTLLVLATYTYDIFGERIQTDVFTSQAGVVATTRFAFQDQNAFADLNGSNVLQMRRLYLDGVDQLFARITSSATAAWYLPDRLGSVRGMVDASGVAQDTITYEGFGKIATESNANFGDRYKFTSRELDTESGLQYNRARYFQSEVGRWITRDPTGFDAHDANLYRYVSNQPTYGLDPWGLWKITRKSLSSTADAESEHNDTIAGLAHRIGLGLKEFREWADFPEVDYRLSNGRIVNDSSINAYTQLAACQPVRIPNIVYVIWVGDMTDWGGERAVSWQGDISYLKKLGFDVEIYKYRKGDTDTTLLQEFADRSTKIHGLHVTGHGNPKGFGTSGGQWWTQYSEVRSSLKHGLGLTILNVCSSDWSRKEPPGAAFFGADAMGGKDLKADSPNAKFGGHKGLLIPVTETIHPQELLKPGEQGTNK